MSARAFRHLHPAMAAREVPQVPAWGEANKEKAIAEMRRIDGHLSLTASLHLRRGDQHGRHQRRHHRGVLRPGADRRSRTISPISAPGTRVSRAAELEAPEQAWISTRCCATCALPDLPRRAGLRSGPAPPAPPDHPGGARRAPVHRSQAPGTRAHASGRPFTDASGIRLRSWLGLDEARFYDPARVAIVPMGHCFPGQDAKGGDLPPRRECAPPGAPAPSPRCPTSS